MSTFPRTGRVETSLPTFATTMVEEGRHGDGASSVTLDRPQTSGCTVPEVGLGVTSDLCPVTQTTPRAPVRGIPGVGLNCPFQDP